MGKESDEGFELSGKALGLIGFGRIAQSVGQIAQTIGMEVHAYDPYLPPKVAKSQDARLHKTLESLFSNCTHISIHCNLTDETHHLVNAERLASMPHIGKDGSRCGSHIVNCARGGIVDEDAVLQALESGHSPRPLLTCLNMNRLTPATLSCRWSTSTVHLTLVHPLSKPKDGLAWTSQPT